MNPKYKLLLVVLLGFALRLPGLFANTFHADEALFGSWARLIAVWRDPLLQSVAVDKPPLLFYVQAPFYQMVGNVEWAARLPNFLVSVLVVPLTAVLTARLASTGSASTGSAGGERRRLSAVSEPVELLAALLVACSPLAIQFSATGFTDPLMSFFVLLAVCCAIKNDQWAMVNGQWSMGGALLTSYFLLFPFLAGFFLGLALATKYQAVLFVPLVVGLGVRFVHGRVFLPAFALGLLLPLTAVAGWEIARTGTFTLWSAQMSGYGGVRLAWSWELWPRLQNWLWLWGAMLGVGWVTGCRVQGARSASIHHSQFTIHNSQFIIFFIIAYALLHWLLAVPVWDRYLLPLVPLTAVAIALLSMSNEQGAMSKTNPSHFALRPSHATLSISILLLLVQGFAAAQGRFALGSTSRSDQGAAEIASVLQDEPYGTVLYDHWYSWHWRYHFFDRGVYVSWFPHGAHLAEELHVFGNDGHNRYLVLPNNNTAVPLHRTVKEAGFTLQPIYKADGMTLYQLTMNNE